MRAFYQTDIFELRSPREREAFPDCVVLADHGLTGIEKVDGQLRCGGNQPIPVVVDELLAAAPDFELVRARPDEFTNFGGATVELLPAGAGYDFLRRHRPGWADVSISLALGEEHHVSHGVFFDSRWSNSDADQFEILRQRCICGPAMRLILTPSPSRDGRAWCTCDSFLLMFGLLGVCSRCCYAA